MSTHPAARSIRSLWLSTLLCLLGGGLRLLRLEWQPLWWDEGYSVYFATEPLAQMLRLTAQDIHPPLYYALLHLWLVAFGSASPLLLRLFSVLIGLLSLPVIWWLARVFYPARPRLALWTLLLLAFSPIHIFYSQEVRMYGLEMLLGMASTGFFWRLANSEWRIANGELRMGKAGVWAGYVIATSALLYTEYYAALLPLAHGLWALWRFRGQARRLLPLAAGWMTVALAYLPWLLYAVPELIPYVSQKIVADADRPLGILDYTLRHLTAFTAGHILSPDNWLLLMGWLASIALLLLVLLRISLFASTRRSPVPTPQSPIPILLLFPFAVSFALNLRLPFFPEGGERVLLFVLPYFLIGVAAAGDDLLRDGRAWARATAAVGLLGLLLGAGAGVWTLYTVPRYTEDDYRPLIRQTAQQGGETDTVLAVFPWQVGYWRAYAPVWGRGDLHGPWPLLSPSPAWGADVQAAIDSALDRGKLWFPAHLSLGGILEGEIEDYLRSAAPTPAGDATLNFENRWYSPSTRLSGWARTPPPTLEDVAADFSEARLRGAGLSEQTVLAANDVLAVGLVWDAPPAAEMRVTLRLVDEGGLIWAQRDYAPLGSWSSPGAAGGASDQIGLLIPPGIPPGSYWLGVGVGPAEGDALLPAAGSGGDLAEIGRVRVGAPDSPLPALRLPMQRPLDKPTVRDGVRFLGASGFDPAAPILAGAEMNLSIFVQAAQPPAARWEIYAGLLDEKGNGVAGWEGWPLPGYPPESWLPGAQVRLPVRFYLPATLAPGDYTLAAGLRDPATGEKGDPVPLGGVSIERRAASFAPPQPKHTLPQPAVFGSHAALLGYDAVIADDGTIALTLYWQVEQTLLPPHHVFVHLHHASGALLAQDDGVPGRGQVAAPSNTWMPGEYLIDPHTLAGASGPLTALIGLYEPVSGVRLPVSVNGQTVGDVYPISLEIP